MSEVDVVVAGDVTYVGPTVMVVFVGKRGDIEKQVVTAPPVGLAKTETTVQELVVQAACDRFVIEKESMQSAPSRCHST